MASSLSGRASLARAFIHNYMACGFVMLPLPRRAYPLPRRTPLALHYHPLTVGSRVWLLGGKGVSPFGTNVTSFLRQPARGAYLRVNISRLGFSSRRNGRRSATGVPHAHRSDSTASGACERCIIQHTARQPPRYAYPLPRPARGQSYYPRSTATARPVQVRSIDQVRTPRCDGKR